jgi:hypothetical protein
VREGVGKVAELEGEAGKGLEAMEQEERVQVVPCSSQRMGRSLVSSNQIQPTDMLSGLESHTQPRA